MRSGSLQPLRGIQKSNITLRKFLTKDPGWLLMETNLIGYNIDSSTPMHFTGQEGNNCITCGIWGGCVDLMASLAVQEDTDEGTASTPVTPVKTSNVTAMALPCPVMMRLIITDVKPRTKANRHRLAGLLRGC